MDDSKNADNLIRHNDKPWLKTYDRLGLNYNINLPSNNTSLIDVFEQNLNKYADRTAYVCMGAELSFADVDEYSRQIAVYLQSLGLKKGDKVAVMMPNILQLPVTMIGVLRAGMTLVNVNPLYTTKELEHQLDDSDAKVLFILENFAKTYADIDESRVHVVVTAMGDLMGSLKGFMVTMWCVMSKRWCHHIISLDIKNLKACWVAILPVATNAQAMSP